MARSCAWLLSQFALWACLPVRLRRRRVNSEQESIVTLVSLLDELLAANPELQAG